MARWSEAQAWIRPHSQPSSNIYDVATDGSNHLSRDRFDIPDSGRAPSAGEERGLVRSFRRRRLTGDIRRTRHRYPIEQSHHGCRGHLHVHVAVADDSDLAARRLVRHPRRSATKESAAGPAGAATGHTAGPAARSTAGATGSTGPAAACSCSAAATTTAEEHAGSARNSSEKVAAGKKRSHRWLERPA